MKRPRLEVDAATGKQYLTVWYHPNDKDFTKINKDAFRYHKISEEELMRIPVLLLPVKKKGDPLRSPKRRRLK